MTRDAKLFFLEKDWRPLIEQFEKQRIITFKSLVAIYKIGQGENHYYAIVSLHDNVDKTVEAYGAKEALSDDRLRNNLNDERDLIYGNPLAASFLK